MTTEPPIGLGKHLVDNAPSVGVLRCSKNPVDARDKNIQQRAESLSLAGASQLHIATKQTNQQSISFIHRHLIPKFQKVDYFPETCASVVPRSEETVGVGLWTTSLNWSPWK